MSSATFYKWRAKFGGMGESIMARLKKLKTENTRLKKVYAGARLKAEIIKEAIEKSGEAFAPTGALSFPRHLATMLQKRAEGSPRI